jgi:hypothetical protein
MATRYMFLLYGDEAGMADVTPEQWDQMIQAHNAWAESVHAAGATIVSGEALSPSTTSTTPQNGGSPPSPRAFAEPRGPRRHYRLRRPDQALALTHAIGVVEVPLNHPDVRRLTTSSPPSTGAPRSGTILATVAPADGDLATAECTRRPRAGPATWGERGAAARAPG